MISNEWLRNFVYSKRNKKNTFGGWLKMEDGQEDLYEEDRKERLGGYDEV